MVKPVVVNNPGQGSIFWCSLDANVGANCPNRIDDVQLVQFGYVCALRNPKSAVKIPPELRAALTAVQVGPPCTGKENDPLVIAIRAHEKVRGGAQDGRVSVAPIGSYSQTYDGEHNYIINTLVGNIVQVTKDYYPRIFLNESCRYAAKLTEVVKAACYAS